MKRIRLLLIFLVITLWTAAIPWTDAGAQSPHCILQFHANQWCFTASQVNQAERRMPVQPIKPTAIVKAVTQLDLLQVSLTGVHTEPDAIHFIFELSPFHHHAVITPLPRVVVTEALARVAHRGIRVFNQGNGPHGPWELTTNLTRAPLSLAITSNLQPATLRRIARRIMQKDQHRLPYGPPTIQQLAARGMIFTPLPPIPGTITQAEAIAKARAWAPRLNDTGVVSIVAQFGRFTDLHYQHNGGLVIKDRLVWLVTFFGPGVSIPSSGPCCAPHPVHHAISAVVDAKSGAVLMGFS